MNLSLKKAICIVLFLLAICVLFSYLYDKPNLAEYDKCDHEYKKTDSIYAETEKNTDNFVLNTHSKKIHKTTCGTGDLISPKNRKSYTGNIDDLFEMGYTTCGNYFK